MLGTAATMLLRTAPQASSPAQAAPQQPPEARPESALVPGERLPQRQVATLRLLQAKEIIWQRQITTQRGPVGAHALHCFTRTPTTLGIPKPDGRIAVP